MNNTRKNRIGEYSEKQTQHNNTRKKNNTGQKTSLNVNIIKTRCAVKSREKSQIILQGNLNVKSK